MSAKEEKTEYFYQFVTIFLVTHFTFKKQTIDNV